MHCTRNARAQPKRKKKKKLRFLIREGGLYFFAAHRAPGSKQRSHFNSESHTSSLADKLITESRCSLGGRRKRWRI